MKPVTTAQASDLRGRLKAAGLFELRPMVAFSRFLLLLGLSGGLLTAFLLAPIWAAPVLLPLLALSVSAAVLYGHEGSHNSFSKNKTLNAVFAHACFPAMAGLGLTFWDRRHNGPHHAHPNLVTEERRDPDIKLWPLATCVEDYEGAGPLRRFFQTHLQGPLFWPLTGFVHLRMRGISVLMLGKRLTKEGPSWAVFVEAACLAFHYTTWLVLPSLIWGVVPTLITYMVLGTLISWVLSIIFVPAHVGLPIYRDYPDFWSLQLYGTQNILLPKWLSYFYVGLDHQVEHHLFPKLPSYNMHAASPIVRQWAKENDLPYQAQGFWQGIAMSTRFLSGGWNVQPEQLEQLESAAK